MKNRLVAFGTGKSAVLLLCVCAALFAQSAPQPQREYGLLLLAWTYGTEFNASPLGYELYFTHYLQYGNRLFGLYLKAGKPFQNLGLGIRAPGLLRRGSFTAGIELDLWKQDIWGTGGAAMLSTRYWFPGNIGFLVRTGWKSQGYLLGKRIEESPPPMAGLGFRF